MFAIAAVLSTLFFFVAAAPGGSTSVSQCNTGSAQCCNQVFDAKTTQAIQQAKGLGINISGLTGQLGFGCGAINVIGVGNGANCAQTPVCCQGNQFNGLVNVGCSPISA